MKPYSNTNWPVGHGVLFRYMAPQEASTSRYRSPFFREISVLVSSYLISLNEVLLCRAPTHAPAPCRYQGQYQGKYQGRLLKGKALQGLPYIIPSGFTVVFVRSGSPPSLQVPIYFQKAYAHIYRIMSFEITNRAEVQHTFSPHCST